MSTLSGKLRRFFDCEYTTMDRPTFLTVCRRRALEIALGHPNVAARLLALSAAHDEMIFRAAELGIDGAELCWIPGYEEIRPVLPPTLDMSIFQAFAGELFEEFTAHQRIRLGAEFRQLQEVV